jgi:hypothetical protein
MAHTKETEVVRSNTLEQWRRKTNKISFDLGSLSSLDSNLTDSILEFTATAGQTNFYSDSLAIAFAAQEEVDNIAGSVILVPGATIASEFVADELVFQGTEGAETWQAKIVSVSDDKIIFKQSTGNFSASADIILDDDVAVTIDAADLSSLVSESYRTVYAEVYNGSTELEQEMITLGFHAPTYNSRIVLTGSPTIPDSFVEGATIYQGTVGSETFVGTILYSEGTSNVHIKSRTSGAFSASAMVKVGSGDTNNRILAANISTMVQVDEDHVRMIELHSPAAAGDIIKVVFHNAVRALNELQDDIGITENLTTTATNLVGSVNELDAEIGATSEFSSVTSTNNTVSTAIQKLHTEIGDIASLDTLITSSNLVAASNELQTDIGDVSTLATTDKTVVTAINEHETDIGNMSFTGLDADNISAALREIRVDIGDVTAANMGTTASNLTGAMLELETEIDTLNTRVEPTQDFHANFVSDTIMDGINELMTDLGDVTAANMGTTADTVVGAMLELETEIDTLNTYTGVSTVLDTVADDLADAINEHEGDIGNMTFTGLTATDISAAIRELRTDLGDVTAANMGTTASNAVEAILEIETEIDTLNTRVAPAQAFNAWFDSDTIMDGINELATEKFNLTSSTDQTINSNVTFTTGNTLTIPQGATLDVSAGSILIGGGGSALTFDTAFIVLGSNNNTEGLQIDRSEITGVSMLTTNDAKFQWNEGKVGTGSNNTSHRAWEIVGFTNDSTPVVNTSDVVTFYNAKDLVSNNSESNMSVTWDSTNQNFDFSLDNNISVTSVTASGNVGAATMSTGTLATTGNVTVGGNLTVSGTVTTINTETVNIADNIIVLNSNETGTPSEDAGFEVERGTATNVSLAWDESEDRWIFTNNGTTFYNIPVPSEYDNYSSWTIRDGDSNTYTVTSGDTLQIAEGTGINSDFTADDVLTITNTKPFDSIGVIDGDGTSVSLANTNTIKFLEGSGTGASININHTDVAGPAFETTFTVNNTDRGSSQNIFKNVAVSGQNTIVADSNNDTLTVSAGNAMVITTNATTDTLSIAHADTSALSGSYGGNNNGVVIEDITVDSNGHITAVGTRDLDGRFDNYQNWSLFVDNVDKDNVTSGEKVDFRATAPLSVAHTIDGGNVLTWTHDASGVTASTYGQSGAENGDYIKSITVNATGHITGISSDNFDDRYDKYTSWTAKDHDGTTYTVTSGDTLQYKEGSGMDVNFTADDVLTFTNTDRGSSQNIFKNVAVSGQNTIVADNNNDTLTIVGGNAITVTTDSGTDTLTINHSDTSSQASSNNSGRTYIQDVTLDTYGHVTGLQTATETVINTDERYTFDVVAAAGSNNNPYLKIEGSTENPQYVQVNGGSGVVVTRVNDASFTIDSKTMVTDGLSNDYNGDGSVNSADALDQLKGKKSGTPQIGVSGAAGTGIYLRDTRAGNEAAGNTDTIGSLTIGTSAGSTYHTNATTYDGNAINHYIPSSASGGVFNVYSADGTGTVTNVFSILGSTGNINLKSGATIDGVDISVLNTTVSGITSDTGTPAVLSNGSTPSLNSGISAAEMRTLIGVVNDTGTPAITSNGSTPSLNSGISAAEIRTLIGAGTSSAANPAITTDGSTPSLASGISAAEVRTLIDVEEFANSGGTAPYYGVRAWFAVSFSAADEYTAASFSLSAGGNISSITLDTTSKAKVNFTTNMEDNSYAVSAIGNRFGVTHESTQAALIIGNPVKTTSYFRLNFYDKIDGNSTSNWQAPSFFSGMVIR